MTLISASALLRPPTRRSRPVVVWAVVVWCAGLVVGAVLDRGRTLARAGGWAALVAGVVPPCARRSLTLAPPAPGGAETSAPDLPPARRVAVAPGRPIDDAATGADTTSPVERWSMDEPTSGARSVRLRYDRQVAVGRRAAALLLLVTVPPVHAGLLGADKSGLLWSVVVGVVVGTVVVSLVWPSWTVFPAGLAGRGLLVQQTVGVPVMCVTLWHGAAVSLARGRTGGGRDIVVRVALGRRRAASVTVVAVRGGTTVQLTPVSLRALAAAVCEPSVPGGPEVARLLREQADHVEAGGSVDDSPVVRAVACP